jgi:serine acetyltransferase
MWTMIREDIRAVKRNDPAAHGWLEIVLCHIPRLDHGAGVVIGETAVVGDHCVLFHNVTLGGTGKYHGQRPAAHASARRGRARRAPGVNPAAGMRGHP